MQKPLEDYSTKNGDTTQDFNTFNLKTSYKVKSILFVIVLWTVISWQFNERLLPYFTNKLRRQIMQPDTITIYYMNIFMWKEMMIISFTNTPKCHKTGRIHYHCSYQKDTTHTRLQHYHIWKLKRTKIRDFAIYLLWDNYHLLM